MFFYMLYIFKTNQNCAIVQHAHGCLNFDIY